MAVVNANRTRHIKPDRALVARAAGLFAAAVSITCPAGVSFAQSHPTMPKETRAKFEAEMMRQYMRCWLAPANGNSDYEPTVAVHFARDGSLIDAPKLRNPPLDKDGQADAAAALRAVQRCTPLRISDEFKPFYDDWKTYNLRFHANKTLN